MASTRRRMGDRKDGRLLRSLNPFSKFIPYIMPTRVDRLVNYEESFEVSTVDKRLRQLRVEGYKGIGILHFLIACYIRVVSMLPGVNRFVAGRRIYAHNDITVVLTVKHSMSIDATETTIKVHFQPTDTIFDVYRKMNEKIEEIKTAEENNNTEDVAEAFSKLPRFLIRFAITVLRVMDYFGWLPQNIMDNSLNHASLLISDAGSYNTAPVYKQIGNYGTLPFYLSFGKSQHVFEMERSGLVTDTRHIHCKVTLDSRLAEPRYYGQFLNAMRYLFAHPDILERSPSRVVEDVG